MKAKFHEIESRILLAVCDKEHIGKTFTEGEIEFKASEKFYGGEDITPEELEKAFFKVDTVNLFGNKCVDLAIKNGLVSEKGTIKVKGIKHAQIYRT